MHQEPASPGPRQDGNLPGVPAGSAGFPELGSPRWQVVPSSPDWDEGYLAALADDEEPGDPDLEEDRDSAPPGLDDAELAALIAEAREVTADQARTAAVAARLGTAGALAAAGAAALGRRGPGMPGSARSFPGEYAGPAAGFAAGKPLDTAPGCPALGLFAEDASDADDRCRGAADDEVLGLICAWERIEANASARKHALVADGRAAAQRARPVDRPLRTAVHHRTYPASHLTGPSACSPTPEGSYRIDRDAALM